MIALYRERCEPDLGSRISQVALREIFRSAAFAGNPDKTRYSTPTPIAPDYWDGAGFLAADPLEACPSGDEEVLVNLAEGDGTPMPEGRSDYQMTWTSPGAQSLKNPAAYGYAPGPSSGRKDQTLATLSAVPGNRIRATWSWSGCATSATGTAPVSSAVDYDLFLYHVEGQNYVWASQTIHDNNEGFDFEVQPNQGGTYKVILAWPVGATSCEGTVFEPGGFGLFQF